MFPTNALIILPTAPPAEINPIAKDRTTVGNNSDKCTIAKVHTVVIANRTNYLYKCISYSNQQNLYDKGCAYHPTIFWLLY